MNEKQVFLWVFFYLFFWHKGIEKEWRSIEKEKSIIKNKRRKKPKRKRGKVYKRIMPGIASFSLSFKQETILSN